MREEAFVQEHESLLTLKPWVNDEKQLVVGFTTKHGGQSKGFFKSLNLGLHVYDQKEDVVANRQQIATILNMGLNRWICSEQTHRPHIKKVSKEDCGLGSIQYETAIKDVDGIYTDEKGILLTSFYADCVPLYFFAKKQGLIGLAHAGWKGTVSNIGGNMIDAFLAEGATCADIQVAIGPSIHSCCYIVDNHVIKGIVNQLQEDAPQVYEEIAENQYQLDLRKANTYLLRKKGILPKQIIETSYCTSCEEKLFFSHRRDKGKTGRMMSYIGLRRE